ncbi:MAG: isocitrate dehydrogenase (NADP(+)) [Candidatus Ranarchaeia archaeon]
MSKFDSITPPSGDIINLKNGKMNVPDKPIIPYISGDGVGRDIIKAGKSVINKAIELTYSKQKEIAWFEIFAGSNALEKYGELLPEDTIKAIREYLVALKGPLTTPVGQGFRSLNVTLRQIFDLYACIRPVYYIEGLPSPMKHPENVNLVVFRENIEDVYQGIEWKENSEEVRKISSFLKSEFGIDLRPDVGLGLKPISKFGSQRLVRKAMMFAKENGKKILTLMHKGNIMKFTEGAFRDWGYDVIRNEFSDISITEKEVNEKYSGEIPGGKILVNDRIADNMFQQVLTRTQDYQIIATTNLNGDYISDALAAQIGGLGVAPGANIGDYMGLFEPTHGSAPKYADKDVANPTGLILSAKLMLDYLGWKDAGVLVLNGISKAIREKKVTQDLARQISGVKPLRTSEFTNEVINNMEKMSV